MFQVIAIISTYRLVKMLKQKEKVYRETMFHVSFSHSAHSIKSSTSYCPVSAQSDLLTCPKSAKPTCPNSTRPTCPKSARPTCPHSARPTCPKSARPTCPKSARPTCPNSARPICPSSARPNCPRSAKPTTKTFMAMSVLGGAPSSAIRAAHQRSFRKAGPRSVRKEKNLKNTTTDDKSPILVLHNTEDMDTANDSPAWIAGPSLIVPDMRGGQPRLPPGDVGDSE